MSIVAQGKALSYQPQGHIKISKVSAGSTQVKKREN